MCFFQLHSLDVNECEAMPPHCEQNCRNTPGSFACSCNLGYVLAADQLSCHGNFSVFLIQNLLCTHQIVIFINYFSDLL